ncbi:MAG: hypothetical protein WCL32_24705, partial [Planctomycetota bacterium]
MGEFLLRWYRPSEESRFNDSDEIVECAESSWQTRQTGQDIAVQTEGWAGLMKTSRQFHPGFVARISTPTELHP